MIKGLLHYYFFPTIYLAGILLLEFYPLIFFFPIPIAGFVLCLIGLAKIPFKKIPFAQKIVLMLFLSLPVLDLVFGLQSGIRDYVKGGIVLNAIDDGVVHTRSIIIREKNGKLKGEYEFAAAGFGKPEEVDVIVEDSTILTVHLKSSIQHLWFDKEKNQLVEREKQLHYRILCNTLLK